MLRNVEKRGVHAARNGPSPPPTPAGGPVARPEMSTANRLGSREESSRAGPPQERVIRCRTRNPGRVDLGGQPPRSTRPGFPGGVGRFGGEPHGQHGVRGAEQRHGSQPERAEGAEDVLLLEGLVDSSGGNLLQQVQLQLLLAGEDPEGEGRRGSNTGHDGEVDRSCVDASGVDQATSYPTCVGHDRISPTPDFPIHR